MIVIDNIPDKCSNGIGITPAGLDFTNRRRLFSGHIWKNNNDIDLHPGSLVQACWSGALEPSVRICHFGIQGSGIYIEAGCWLLQCRTDTDRLILLAYAAFVVNPY